MYRNKVDYVNSFEANEANNEATTLNHETLMQLDSWHGP